MKISNFFVLLPLLQIALFAQAGETNELYLTYDDSGLYVGKSEEIHHQKLVTEAKNTRDSLPAKDFPEGNWGESVNGLQLSMRFDKQTYTNDEPITAVLLMRNVTNQYVGYNNSPLGNGDGPIGFVVTTVTGQILTAEKPSFFISGAGDAYEMAPQMQRKHFERLNREYHLTNGTYLVHASIKIPGMTPAVNGKPPQMEWDEVKSAEVRIKIEDSPPK